MLSLILLEPEGGRRAWKLAQTAAARARSVANILHNVTRLYSN